MSLSDWQVIDKNETLKPPKGFTLTGTRGEGPLIVLEYELKHSLSHVDYVSIFLNDQGREVLRAFRTSICEPERIPYPEASDIADALVGPPPNVIFWRRLRLWWTEFKKRF